ncbi:AAA family ATPase [Burkholderia sp. WAC0059]|uniref:AAA family ATPase n=1 Tax=Burkholderia sp. WAC0059 TaxID=2066022 RepID=UPI0035B52FF7
MLDEMSAQLCPGSQSTILLICGPTGIGKTTLTRRMVNDAHGQQRARMDCDAGIIPAIYVEAPASGETDFSWRLFFQRILAQCDGPLDIPKVAYGVDATTGRVWRSRGPNGNSLAALRTAVENTLRERQVQFIVVDEAAHMIRQSRRNRLEIHLDTLKSLANQSGTQMVLSGSYDLYRLMALSGQLARRTHVLHFARYREDNANDVRAFKSCLLAFEKALPDLWTGQLMQYAEALHGNTLGCIGTLSAVLSRSARFAEQGGKWSVSTLERALLTEAQRNKILEEILEGEEAINPSLTRIMNQPLRNGGARAAGRAM